ncbi:hypothetical protein [Streptomyces misionensis]|uniref:hypothetical protein n=1 Tax=Streptomyces misionensis TaxID=67331 RepID=UPI0033E058FF
MITQLHAEITAQKIAALSATGPAPVTDPEPDSEQTPRRGHLLLLRGGGLATFCVKSLRNVVGGHHAAMTTAVMETTAAATTNATVHLRQYTAPGSPGTPKAASTEPVTAVTTPASSNTVDTPQGTEPPKQPYRQALIRPGVSPSAKRASPAPGWAEASDTTAAPSTAARESSTEPSATETGGSAVGEEMSERMADYGRPATPQRHLTVVQ